MILVDTDILIAHLRGYPVARDWLAAARAHSGKLFTSAVTITEIAGGMRSHERSEVTRLLASFTTLPITERVAWESAALMRTYRRSHAAIGLGDYLMAGTALVEGLELATLNVRHFPMFPGLAPPFALSS